MLGVAGIGDDDDIGGACTVDVLLDGGRVQPLEIEGGDDVRSTKYLYI